DYWEGQYAESSQRWSGRVNPATAEVAAALPVPVNGSALDLGCGEGGDAVWLAKQGWQVTAVDISATAIARGIENAREAGVADAVTWVSQDLSAWATEETFDLVTASYFHSSVELPRTEILRRAAARVRRGGHLLIVSHVFETPADIPAWALRHHETDDPEDPQLQDELSVLLTPDAEEAELDLDEADWQVVRKEIRPRDATGPDGDETATVKDGIVLLRRAWGAAAPDTVRLDVANQRLRARSAPPCARPKEPSVLFRHARPAAVLGQPDLVARPRRVEQFEQRQRDHGSEDRAPGGQQHGGLRVRGVDDVAGDRRTEGDAEAQGRAEPGEGLREPARRSQLLDDGVRADEARGDRRADEDEDDAVGDHVLRQQHHAGAHGQARHGDTEPVVDGGRPVPGPVQGTGDQGTQGQA